MAVDVKEYIEKAVKKITADPKMIEKFKKDPIKVVESVLGVDLPDEKLKPIVDGVKAKITADKVGAAAGALKNLLGK